MEALAAADERSALLVVYHMWCTNFASLGGPLHFMGRCLADISSSYPLTADAAAELALPAWQDLAQLRCSRGQVPPHVQVRRWPGLSAGWLWANRIVWRCLLCAWCR